MAGVAGVLVGYLAIWWPTVPRTDLDQEAGHAKDLTLDADGTPRALLEQPPPFLLPSQLLPFLHVVPYVTEITIGDAKALAARQLQMAISEFDVKCKIEELTDRAWHKAMDSCEGHSPMPPRLLFYQALCAMNEVCDVWPVH